MRLFIATPITQEVEKKLADIIVKLKNIGGPVKWVAPSNIHLTMKFLGDTDENLLPQLSSLIDAVSSNQKVIDCRINSLGGFPNLNRPRVIWAGLEGDIAELEQLALRVDKAAHNLGWSREDRSFKAHLTFGRVKEPRGMHDITEFLKTYQVAPMNLQFNRLILFKSTLTPRGPIYDKLHEVQFKKS